MPRRCGALHFIHSDIKHLNIPSPQRLVTYSWVEHDPLEIWLTVKEALTKALQVRACVCVPCGGLRLCMVVGG